MANTTQKSRKGIFVSITIISLLLNVITLTFCIFLFNKNISLNNEVSILKQNEVNFNLCESDLKECDEKVGELENIISQNENNDSPYLDDENLPYTVILDVKKYAQTHPASCESASAYAAMSYFGSEIIEDEIISEIGADLSPRYYDDEGNLYWGNPQEKFVGNIDGLNVYVDGYGVYNQPIYKMLSNHGFSSSISKIGWDVDELLNYVRRGFPAIVWISNDYSTKKVGVMIDSKGNKNPWIMGEHAVVIRGVEGNTIYIMDVGNGSYYSVTKEKFERGFANLDNMGIVVIADNQ